MIEETELHALRDRLRALRFDLAIDLRMQADTRHILRYTDAALLAGFDYGGRFPWLDVTVEWDGDPALVAKRAHAAERYMTLVSAVAAACEPARSAPDAVPAQAALAWLKQLPEALAAPPGFFDRPLVCIHPGAGNRLKQWPAASFVALINLLAETEDVRVVLVGAPDDEPIGREIEAAVPPGVIFSLVGRATLTDLPTILRACALFVGNDSGPKHIAAALGVPTVGIHSANVDAGEWGPLGPRAVAIRRKMSCGPCYISKLEACPRNATCLTGIRPQDVYHVCRPLLRLDTTWHESRNETVAQRTNPLQQMPERNTQLS